MTKPNTHLRQLKFLQIKLLDDVIPQGVRRRKQPAPPTTLLVRNGTGLGSQLGVEDMDVLDLGCTRLEGRADVGVIEDGAGELEFGVRGNGRLPRGNRGG